MYVKGQEKRERGEESEGGGGYGVHEVWSEGERSTMRANFLRMFYGIASGIYAKPERQTDNYQAFLFFPVISS